MAVAKNNLAGGFEFLYLSLYAFAGLGLEAVLAFLIEPLLYGKELSEFTTTENIIHRIITCILWGVVAYGLVRIAKKKYEFDIFSYKSSIGLLNWAILFSLLILSMIISYISWEGFKVYQEFLSNGWLKFIFQYIYYLFEATLFVLIIVFAQKAEEIWFKKRNIPWGGIFVALTWGLVHILTKGELLAGVLSLSVGLIWGTAYVVSKKICLLHFRLYF